MSDFLLWKNGIQNSKSPTSLKDVVDGSGFIATATISGVTTNSEWKMSLWDAYLNLYEKVHDGERPIPKSTTTEALALTEILDGTSIINVTNQTLEVCIGSKFQNSAGSGTMAPVAFGEMVEDNSSGSTIDTTTKLWSTASVGEIDPNDIISFVDETDGDKLVVGTGGAGTYQIHFSCTFTNAGGKLTKAGIHVNGAEVGKLEDEHDGDSSEKRDLRGQGFLVLAVGDEVTMHVVSETSSDVVTVFHCHITMKRMT